MKLRVTIIVLLICVGISTALNILVLFPHPGKSHFIAFSTLFIKLAEKGHNVTVVSHFPLQKSIPRYKDIDLRDEDDEYVESIKIEDVSNSRFKYYWTIDLIKMMVEGSCSTLKSNKIKQLIESDEKFDLILFEMFISDCYLGFVHKLKVPFMGLSSCGTLPWTNPHFGNPENPSYIPSILHRFSDKMSFLERTENTLALLYFKYHYNKVIVDPTYTQAKEVFGKDMPHPDELSRNASILLVNVHFSLNLPKPVVPNVIDVGGISLKPNVAKLPQNLEKWINESTHGVIYFSMGSMIKGHSFPAETRKAFLKAFSRLPQRILWKWENDSLPEQPANVMIQKWMPQFDILCHPNVKAYISHGGLLGTTEAVHCGVPMVVMPQYGDQFVNAAALQASGGGVILDFKEATEETIYNALQKVLEPSFNQKVKELSSRFKDRPMPPLDTAVYWVEYVARHKGAHHMRTKAVGMPWYQYLLLDVIAFLLLVVITTMAAVFYCLRTIFRIICGKAQKVKKN